MNIYLAPLEGRKTCTAQPGAAPIYGPAILDVLSLHPNFPGQCKPPTGSLIQDCRTPQTPKALGLHRVSSGDDFFVPFSSGVLRRRGEAFRQAASSSWLRDLCYPCFIRVSWC